MPDIVTIKILSLRFTQKLGNYRGSDVRGNKQFELHLPNDKDTFNHSPGFTSHTIINDGNGRRKIFGS